jgi:hypothetical protein
MKKLKVVKRFHKNSLTITGEDIKGLLTDCSLDDLVIEIKPDIDMYGCTFKALKYINDKV